MEKHKSEDFCNVGDNDGYDAVVVGSGYGGSVAACRLSMAGFKVCLLEKGHKWEAHDFPTHTFKIMSTVRMENTNLGINIGPNDALFQVHIQDDSLAATACGLGGGSLVNAGVMFPTTVGARRNPKWPEAWEKDWERCEASASDMLRLHSFPMKFDNSQIMHQVIDKEYDKNIQKPLKLSLNIDMEETGKSRQPGNCLACGNCLSGCPYNAKNSTDKTYLIAAIQAGCIIKTECEVQYVVRNVEDNYKVEGGLKGRRQQRWLVYVNEFDYVASDIVILSAGVFGTTKILFQSQLRGLSVSQKLGSGLSCNGNNVAYLAGSPAPLNASGLNRKQFSGIPFQKRPGPSISSSYTSSLGFTIQSAVIPTAYPCFFFRGMTTYGWKSSNWFLHEMIDCLKHVLGLKRRQDMILNVMGHDDSNGKLTFEKDSNRIVFEAPHDPLLPRKVEALQKLAKKLGGILLMSRYRSTSVHLLGGCVASSDVSSGVCNPDGQVFDNTSPTGVHTGLYTCDASIIPCSVGINPSLTIAAAAEHVSRNLVQNAVNYVGNSVNRCCNKKEGSVSKFTTKKSCRDEVAVKEIMRGQVGGMPCTAYLKLRFKATRVSEQTEKDTGRSHSLLRGKVGGHILCKGIEMDNMYVIHGEVDLCKTNIKTPYTQYMHYHLLIAASSGSRYVVEGRKIMNPYLLALYAWRESTTLNVTITKITENTREATMKLKGKLHISPLELLKSMCSLEGDSTSRIKFIFLLMQSLLRTYVLQVPRSRPISITIPSVLACEPYPNCRIHEIITEDECIISFQQWKSPEEKKVYPVLLLNGYSTESYCLPTEPNDLVRTLLKGGRDVLLLQTRLHPLSSAECSSIEDIGRTDIPAAMNKIVELYGESIKVHIVAHCVGGLAIHISLMGGYVSAEHVASISCTNSSMFFKLTPSSSLKMWLPLVPMSMAIMGKKKTLPLLERSSRSCFRHRLLKSVARAMPRSERCRCDECEVFSGVFGNAYWHEKVSQGVHEWMNKEYQARVPMAAFPHLRSICNAGFIVDTKGSNAYLIHPERMALPTLYISGGRPLLVTPHTSFLANEYMKLHQPGHRHERVVVDGFGHSDLLIGEESHVKVFPCILRHIDMAEEEISSCAREGSYNLAWTAQDPYQEDGTRFGTCTISLFIFIFLLLLFLSYPS